MPSPAELWVEALRSGKYQQGYGKLASWKGYCCLGVACEVARENGVDVERDEIDGNVYYDGKKYDLPPAVQKWLGLSNSGGEYGPADLASMNDGGAPFTDIADIIESRPAGLFDE